MLQIQAPSAKELQVFFHSKFINNYDILPA